MRQEQKLVGAAIVVLVLVIAISFAVWSSRGGRDKASSFVSPANFWSWDPAYGSPPLQNPYEPRSQLFRALEGSQVEPPYEDTRGVLAHVQPLQVSAAMTASPDDTSPTGVTNSVDEFRGRRWWWRRPYSRYAAPLWFAGPLARYRWQYGTSPSYYWPGETPTYYGSYPYYATW